MRWLIVAVVAFLLLMFAFADSSSSSADRQLAAFFAEPAGKANPGGQGGRGARFGDAMAEMVPMRGGTAGRASGSGASAGGAPGGGSTRRPVVVQQQQSYGATGVSEEAVASVVAAAMAPLPRKPVGRSGERDDDRDVPMQAMHAVAAVPRGSAGGRAAARSLGFSAAAQEQHTPPLPPAPAPARSRPARSGGNATGRSWDAVGGSDEDDAPPPHYNAAAADDDEDDGPPPAPGPGPTPAAGMRRTASSHALPPSSVGGLSPIGGGRLRAASSAKRLTPASARDAQDENL
jgi:hypothetical protein